MKLGVFDEKADNPYDDIPYSTVDSAPMQALNRKAVSRCVVLLKSVTVSALIKNTGSMAGGETVQAHVKICREGTPNAQLKGLQKLHLAPGEETEVSIHLPKEAFGLYDEEGKLQFYPGEAEIFLGGQAPDSRSAFLTGKTVSSVRVTI